MALMTVGASADSSFDLSNMQLYGYPGDPTSYADYCPWMSVDGDRASASDPFTGKIRYVFRNASSSDAFDGYIALGVQQSDGSYELISDAKHITCAAYASDYTYVNEDTLSFSYDFPVGTTMVYGLVSNDSINWQAAANNDLYAYELTATDTSLSGQWFNMSLSINFDSGVNRMYLVKDSTYTLTVSVTNGSTLKSLPAEYIYIYDAYTDSLGNVESGAYRGYVYSWGVSAGNTGTYTYSFTPTETGWGYAYTWDETMGYNYGPWIYTYATADDKNVAMGIEAVNGDKPGVAVGEGTLRLTGGLRKPVGVYNLGGQRVATLNGGQTVSLPEGIYIVEGEKVVVK